MFQQLPAAGEKVTHSILLPRQPPSPTHSLVALPHSWGNLEASSSPTAESTLRHSCQLSCLALPRRDWGDKKSKCGKVNCAPFIDRAGEGKYFPGCLLAGHRTRSTSPLSRMLSWHKAPGGMLPLAAVISISVFSEFEQGTEKERAVPQQASATLALGGVGPSPCGAAIAGRGQWEEGGRSPCAAPGGRGGRKEPGAEAAAWVRQRAEQGFPGIAHPLPGKEEERQQTGTAPVIQRQGGGQESFAFSKNATKGKRKESEPEWLPLGSPGAAERDELPHGRGGWGGWCRTVHRDSHLQNLGGPGRCVSISPLPPWHCRHHACWADLPSQQRCKLKPTLPPSPSRRWTPLRKPSHTGDTT